MCGTKKTSQDIIPIDNVVRLYTSEGEHVLSILPCTTVCSDLATPDGKVLYCGVDNALLEILAEYLGIETL